MTEHTPTPWAATTRRGSWDWVVYSMTDPNIEICQTFHDGTDDNPTGEANAALIVRAVNSHAAMKAALEELIFQIAGDQHDAAEIDKAFGTKLLGAAITRARRALTEA